jgi:hypothetical protein
MITLFRIWLTCAILLIFVAFSISLLWLGRYAELGGMRLSDTQREMVLNAAQLPSYMVVGIQQIRSFINNEAAPELLLAAADVKKPYWKQQFPAPSDSGYLLWSGVSAEHKQSVIRLVRLRDGEILQTWAPDVRNLATQITDRIEARTGNPNALRFTHPLPTHDGNIVFNTGGSLVKLNACNSTPLWLIDEVFHHSNEQQSNGTLVVPTVSHQGYKGNRHLQKNTRDDAIAWISPSGKVLEVRPFSNILIDNGLEHLLLGFSGAIINKDPVHLNEIVPAPSDGAYWKKDDLLISARHLSTVFLYRPSNNKIVWHRTGPWLNQHAAQFLGSDQISVFSNNVYGKDRRHHFLRNTDHNRVFVYNFKTNSVEEPWAALIEQARPVTVTEGRAQVLKDGGLFIEETNFGRHLRFTSTELLWSNINNYSDSKVGLVSWSRYLHEEEAQPLLNALRECTEPTP